jgi:alpha-glucosidase/glucan 1,6-alpha-glucosidase
MGDILIKYNAMTVGELPHTPAVADVLSYVSEKEKQLSMVFQFDIVDIGTGAVRFDTVPHAWTLPDLRERVARTQALMDGTTDGWSTTFLENHDQARSISRWGSEATPELWARSAKMLAMLVASLSGTLYVYQGQEIGMVNAPIEWDISEYKDLDSQNYYKFVQELSNNDPVAVGAAKRAISHLARDHARMPMQWDGTPNAGFTTATAKPWMRVHDNYPELNAKRQALDPSSVLSFWRELLKVRREHPEVFSEGVFVDTDPLNESVFVFEKKATHQKLVVALNFTGDKQSVDLAAQIGSRPYKTMLKNFEGESLEELEAYEGRVYLVDN